MQAGQVPHKVHALFSKRKSPPPHAQADGVMIGVRDMQCPTLAPFACPVLPSPGSLIKEHGVRGKVAVGGDRRAGLAKDTLVPPVWPLCTAAPWGAHGQPPSQLLSCQH